MNISKIQITISSPDPDSDPLTLDVIGTASMTVNHSVEENTNDVCVRIDGRAGNGDIATNDDMQKYLDLFNELILNYR